MELSTSILRAQIKLMKPITNNIPVAVTREAQDKMGTLMSVACKGDVTYEACHFKNFEAEFAIPKEEKHKGAVLYLHGGGYVTGGLEYARGFGTILAAKSGTRTLYISYRLAPEHPYPAALDDAFCAYNHLLSLGYLPQDIVICGESAGGGLSFSLSLKLRSLGLPQAGAIIAMSPWTDLTLSGDSVKANAQADPSLTEQNLLEQARMYSNNPTDGFVSPLFADLTGLAKSLIFVGMDEILLDDSTRMYKKLIGCGCKSTLTVRPEMWHAYILFGIKEADDDLNSIISLITEVTSGISQT